VPGQILIAAGGWHDDSPGGAYRLPTDFARYLVRQGHRVAYVCPSRLAGCDNPQKCEGVEVHRYFVGETSLPGIANLVAHLYRSRGVAARIASRGPVQVLLGHSPLQYLGALSGCRPIRKCYTVHSPFAAELRSNCPGRPRLRTRGAWAAAKRIEAHIYSKSDIVQCFSNYILHRLQQDYGSGLAGKCVVLPAWVDTNRFTPSIESASQVRAHLGVPWNAQVATFITVRRLVPRMGLATLIEAAAILSKEGLDFRLVIAGEGPQLEPLRNQSSALSLQNRVAFLGRVSEEQLVDVYRAGDCFVLPTRSLEGFGLIILEAYACGTPVIAVPVGAIPEVMGASFRDWLARDNSPAALAERMRDFIRNRLIADQARLRQRALEFDFDTVAALHEHVLLQAKPSNIIITQAVGGGLLL
jgi:glycosyltransferase involved in cell wall biosynthesis